MRNNEMRPMSDMAKLAILVSVVALCIFGCVKFVSYLDRQDEIRFEQGYWE